MTRFIRPSLGDVTPFITGRGPPYMDILWGKISLVLSRKHPTCAVVHAGEKTVRKDPPLNHTSSHKISVAEHELFRKLLVGDFACCYKSQGDCDFVCTWQFFVTFLGWLSDPFKG